MSRTSYMYNRVSTVQALVFFPNSNTLTKRNHSQQTTNAHLKRERGGGEWAHTLPEQKNVRVFVLIHFVSLNITHRAHNYNKLVNVKEKWPDLNIQTYPICILSFFSGRFCCVCNVCEHNDVQCSPQMVAHFKWTTHIERAWVWDRAGVKMIKNFNYYELLMLAHWVNKWKTCSLKSGCNGILSRCRASVTATMAITTTDANNSGNGGGVGGRIKSVGMRNATHFRIKLISIFRFPSIILCTHTHSDSWS